jgi:cytochrome c-type biogenesis protein CcmH
MKLRMLLRRPSFLVALAVLLLVGAVWTITAVRAAQPQTLDERVYTVGSELQCPVCNGESVADSSSQVAADMRAVIRAKLASGESEQQVLQYFRARYGDGILETPPVQGFTLLIWLGPVVMLVAGLVVLRAVASAWQAHPRAVPEADDGAGVETLSAEEERRYRLLLQRELEAEEGMPARQGWEGA